MLKRGQPVVGTHKEDVPDVCQTRSCHESIRFNVGDATIRDRTGQPVANHDDSSHEQTHAMQRALALEHWLRKIENHPARHTLQQDPRQNKAYNTFSAESKRMIQDVAIVELFELFETDPKTQCKTCLSYWSDGIVHCTCGHLLKDVAANRGVKEKHWTFFQFQNT